MPRSLAPKYQHNYDDEKNNTNITTQTSQQEAIQTSPRASAGTSSAMLPSRTRRSLRYKQHRLKRKKRTHHDALSTCHRKLIRAINNLRN